MLTIYNLWSSMFISRYPMHKKSIISHIFSLTRHDIKHSLFFLDEHNRWQVGNGNNIDLWANNWLRYKIKDINWKYWSWLISRCNWIFNLCKLLRWIQLFKISIDTFLMAYLFWLHRLLKIFWRLTSHLIIVLLINSFAHDL